MPPLDPFESLRRPARLGGRIGPLRFIDPSWLADWTARKRKPPRGGDLEREPVEPPRPKNLSGGAAAELEFDE
jgi:hypothetical protein